MAWKRILPAKRKIPTVSLRVCYGCGAPSTVTNWDHRRERCDVCWQYEKHGARKVLRTRGFIKTIGWVVRCVWWRLRIWRNPIVNKNGRYESDEDGMGGFECLNRPWIPAKRELFFWRQ